MKIRFQNWVLLTTTLLVILLAVAFLVTVFRTFSTISEDNATTRFELIGNQAASELQSLLQASGRFVLTQTRGESDQLIKAGRIDTQLIVPLFVSGMETDASTYSYFIGLATEEFLQVIAIRGDPRIVDALKSPPEAHYAVRRILPDANGKRSDSYRFYDKNRKEIGHRVQEAKLIPTQRPWYGKALERQSLAVTEPYLFASTGELGITVAAPLPGRIGVLASDISLRSLRGFLAGLALPPNGAIAVQDPGGRVLAFHGQGRLFEGIEIAPMTIPEKIADPRLQLLHTISDRTGSQIVALSNDREKFIVTRVLSQVPGSDAFQVTVFAPLSDFTRAFDAAQRDVVALAVIVLLILLPLAIVGSRQVARSLEAMAHDSERLKHLDFTHRPQKTDSFLYEVNALGEAQFVMHDAIVRRTLALESAQKKLENLIDSGLDLGREKDRNALLRKILWSGKALLNADAGTLYVVTDHQTLRFAQRTSSDELPDVEIPLRDAEGKKVERYMATWCVHRNEPIIVDDVYAETRFDTSGAKSMDAKTGYRTVSMLTVPLSPREGQVIGVLQFLNALDPDTGDVIPFSPELVRFVTAMAAQAAVALDNFQLIEAQKELMESLIKLIAGAIDAKSHYTGGHCERVPELGIMLAQAATEVKEGPLADFGFHTEEEWREFRIGAWLHDCGKVTTPEYVVDKACKLETIYNRIHEVRVRFEVLLRDARIAQLEAIAEGADPQQALAAYEARKAQLSDDFSFIAECNLGGEFMAPEKVERLKAIAAQTWLRHFDDRAGLPHEELKRYAGPAETLPVTERLLDDKPHHIIPRARQDVVDPKWGFKVTVPQHLYNYGEVYNLSVSRGTLTEEERFKINEHVMQSLMMLEQLPLPPSLKRVPEYAGTHHETLVGTGYPRKLSGEELSVPMRIMAIADIFEALTASDRPYKKAKTLSESIKILAFFKKDKHIDPDLFDLFLTSGVYREYAHKYLLPEQIDEVEIEKFIG